MLYTRVDTAKNKKTEVMTMTILFSIYLRPYTSLRRGRERDWGASVEDRGRGRPVRVDGTRNL